MLAQAKELMGSLDNKPILEGTTFVFVWYEKSKHRVFMDVGATVSAFEMNIYLVTGVMPPRQKLLGFEGAFYKDFYAEIANSSAACTSHLAPHGTQTGTHQPRQLTWKRWY